MLAPPTIVAMPRTEQELTGMHEAAAVEAIEGTWNLAETASGITCVGPFRVELQP